MRDGQIIAADCAKVKATSSESAGAVFNSVLQEVCLKEDDIDFCCTTGYGRFDIPFSDMNVSEISCHGRGAFWCDSSIRSVIDIGGQDCKVISLDENGMVKDFTMNDKCAAGTGRCIELLADIIGVELDEIGPLSLKSRGRLSISAKCSIFMEQDVLHHIYNNRKIKDIAWSINNAVARRVFNMMSSLSMVENFCITGGVSKNSGVVSALEKMISVKFRNLKFDPQLIGAIGAALAAAEQDRLN